MGVLLDGQETGDLDTVKANRAHVAAEFEGVGPVALESEVELGSIDTEANRGCGVVDTAAAYEVADAGAACHHVAGVAVAGELK